MPVASSLVAAMCGPSWLDLVGDPEELLDFDLFVAAQPLSHDGHDDDGHEYTDEELARRAAEWQEWERTWLAEGQWLEPQLEHHDHHIFVDEQHHNEQPDLESEQHDDIEPEQHDDIEPVQFEPPEQHDDDIAPVQFEQPEQHDDDIEPVQFEQQHDDSIEPVQPEQQHSDDIEPMPGRAWWVDDCCPDVPILR